MCYLFEVAGVVTDMDLDELVIMETWLTFQTRKELRIVAIFCIWDGNFRLAMIYALHLIKEIAWKLQNSSMIYFNVMAPSLPTVAIW